MEDKEFIGIKIQQNCGDILVVKARHKDKSKSGAALYQCFFEGFEENILFCEKANILRHSVNNNYKQEKEFKEKLYKQNCGYTLRVLEKTNIKESNDSRANYLYRCLFIETNTEVFAIKQKILEGRILNPFIEEEFFKKIYPFVGGETLKVLEKTNKQSKDGSWIYKCQFQKYPYIIFLDKSQIKRGKFYNPRIEIEEFINKEWKQKNGTLIIKKKLNDNYFLCEFKETKNIITARKDHIKNGNVINPSVSYSLSKGEKDLKEYIQSLFKEEIIGNSWNILGNKEIDIYIPSLKIGIEYNGVFWHSNDKKYGVPNDYHLKKSLEAKEKGIKLIHIWEDEWEDNKERIKIWLKNKLFGIEDNLFLGDLSKEPEKITINAVPVPIKRREYICYNCGFS